ncbi:MAG: DUF4383 domain-containing protein [Marmoricola sp.]
MGAAVLAARSRNGARPFLVVGGLVYFLLFVYGLFFHDGEDANVVPLDWTDNWLHLVLSVAMVALGLLLGAPGPPGPPGPSAATAAPRLPAERPATGPRRGVTPAPLLRCASTWGRRGCGWWPEWRPWVCCRCWPRCRGGPMPG